MLKRFFEWIRVKEQVDGRSTRPPFFNEGEIWWCFMGENVGYELNGKNDSFIRPVFILKKYNRYTFFGLPLTTKVKNGNWYYPLDFGGRPQVIILTQGRAYDYRRLDKKMGNLKSAKSADVRAAYVALHKQ